MNLTHIINSSNIKQKEQEKLALVIKNIIDNDHFLSYRSLSYIKKSIHNGDVYLAYDNTKLAGFLFVASLGSEYQEAHCGYTFPEYRNKGVMASLLDKTKEKNKKTLGVTFQPDFAKKLQGYGFKTISFGNLPLFVKVRFVFSRLHPRRLVSVGSHFKTKGSAIYMLRQ